MQLKPVRKNKRCFILVRKNDFRFYSLSRQIDVFEKVANVICLQKKVRGERQRATKLGNWSAADRSGILSS